MRTEPCAEMMKETWAAAVIRRSNNADLSAERRRQRQRPSYIDQHWAFHSVSGVRETPAPRTRTAPCQWQQVRRLGRERENSTQRKTLARANTIMVSGEAGESSRELLGFSNLYENTVTSHTHTHTQLYFTTDVAANMHIKHTISKLNKSKT